MPRSRRLAVIGLATAATAISGTAFATPFEQVAPNATGLSPAVPAGAPAVRGTTPYFTIQFGRTQWVSADKLCKPLPNAVTLGRVATLLKQRGKVASGNVVVKRQGVSQSCFSNYVISPSWNDLTQLRTVYGWTFNSAGMTYANMTTLTPTEQHAEACGSVGALARRGHTRAWGLIRLPQQQILRQDPDPGRQEVLRLRPPIWRHDHDAGRRRTVAELADHDLGQRRPVRRHHLGVLDVRRLIDLSDAGDADPQGAGRRRELDDDAVVSPGHRDQHDRDGRAMELHRRGEHALDQRRRALLRA